MGDEELRRIIHDINTGAYLDRGGEEQALVDIRKVNESHTQQIALEAQERLLVHILNMEYIGELDVDSISASLMGGQSSHTHVVQNDKYKAVPVAKGGIIK